LALPGALGGLRVCLSVEGVPGFAPLLLPAVDVVWSTLGRAPLLHEQHELAIVLGHEAAVEVAYLEHHLPVQYEVRGAFLLEPGLEIWRDAALDVPDKVVGFRYGGGRPDVPELVAGRLPVELLLPEHAKEIVVQLVCVVPFFNNSLAYSQHAAVVSKFRSHLHLGLAQLVYDFLEARLAHRISFYSAEPVLLGAEPIVEQVSVGLLCPLDCMLRLQFFAGGSYPVVQELDIHSPYVISGPDFPHAQSLFFLPGLLMRDLIEFFHQVLHVFEVVDLHQVLLEHYSRSRPLFRLAFMFAVAMQQFRLPGSDGMAEVTCEPGDGDDAGNLACRFYGKGGLLVLLYQAVALYLGHVRAYPVNQPGLPGLVVLEPLAGRAPVLEAEVVERLDAGLAGPTLDANTSTLLLEQVACHGPLLVGLRLFQEQVHFPSGLAHREALSHTGLACHALNL
jgi:hypothetical protein